MITAIRHTGLVVADLDKSLRFWCDVLGFKVSKKMDESGEHIDAILGLKNAKLTTVKLAAPDNNLIELLYFHTHPDVECWNGQTFSTGFTHIALTVADLDKVVKKLTNENVSFNSEPQLSPDGYAKVTYGRCPDGVFIELVEIL